jgi:hypothetical protein
MPKQMPKYGTFAGSRECRRGDLAFRAALAKTAWHENAVHAFQIRAASSASNTSDFDPLDVHLHPVGDAAMHQRFDQGFVGVQRTGVLADNGDLDLAFRILATGSEISSQRSRTAPARLQCPNAASTSSSRPSL